VAFFFRRSRESADLHCFICDKTKMSSEWLIDEVREEEEEIEHIVEGNHKVFFFISIVYSCTLRDFYRFTKEMRFRSICKR